MGSKYQDLFIVLFFDYTNAKDRPEEKHNENKINVAVKILMQIIIISYFLTAKREAKDATREGFLK